MNIDDYEILPESVHDHSLICPVYDKKNHKKVALNLYLYSKYIKVKNGTTEYYQKPSIFNTKGIVKILGVQTPLEREQLPKIFKLFKVQYSEECIHNSALVVTEYMKYGTIKKLMKEYIFSKGTKHDIINPTIRSKIIFGVASIMKRLHKHNIIHQYIPDHIYFDDSYEPLIKLSTFSYIIENELSLFLDGCENPDKFFSPEEIEGQAVTLKSDVFDFAIFLYGMFTGKFDITDFSFGKNFVNLVKFTVSGKKPEYDENIPFHYWRLIEECWKPVPNERPSFDEITDVLKLNKFALNEYGMKTDLNELHEYQNRIDCDDCNEKNPKFFIEEDDYKYFSIFNSIFENETSISFKIVDKRNLNPIFKKIIKLNENQSKIIDVIKIIKEFEIIHKIDHPCVCKSYWINVSEKVEKNISTISIYSEYLEYGLNDLLNMKINNTMKTKIVIDVIHALKYCNKKGIIHHDLKIKNIMFNSIFETKITDFGIVKIKENTINNFSFVQNSLKNGVEFLSPEIFNGNDFDFKTDVYSFGVLLFYIFTGEILKQSIDDKSNGKKILLPSPSDSISSFCIHLISKCLSPNPSDRPSYDDVLNDMRKNSYKLANDVNPIIISKRDKELDLFGKYQ